MRCLSWSKCLRLKTGAEGKSQNNGCYKISSVKAMFLSLTYNGNIEDPEENQHFIIWRNIFFKWNGNLLLTVISLNKIFVGYWLKIKKHFKS